MREQYVHSAVAIRGGVRLFGGPNDLGKDKELEDYDVCRVLVHLPAL